MWAFYALFLPFVFGIVGGLASYLLIHWSHIRFQRQLEYRIEDLEGRVVREVKIRAATEHVRKKNVDADLLERVNLEKKEPEVDMRSWIKKGYQRNG